ncbi:MAG: hypothetical protein WKG00_37590, partial [Polyangiaceae bacterium]
NGAPIPAPVGQVTCDGGSASSSGGGPEECITACHDSDDNSYWAECSGTSCACKYIPNNGSGGGGTSSSVSSGNGAGGAPPSPDNVVCMCQLVEEACGIGFQHCCPAPWQ